MPTPATETDGAPQHTSLGEAAKQVSEHASAIVRLELELASLELKRKLAALGLGIGRGLGAAIFLLFMLGFALATWLALLIVTALLLLLAGLLGLLALGRIKRGTPPVPEQAIREAKLTTAALKSDGSA